jgi:hypothetical protein
MFTKSSINISGLCIASLALFLIVFPLSSSSNPADSFPLSDNIASKFMALPERAYAERQQSSPIRIEGLIQQIVCENNRCSVKMLIESVKRNKSARTLAKGNIVTIIDIEARDSVADSRFPDRRQAPVIGLPDNSVQMPSPSSRTEAWLRPTELSGDPDHSNSYQLMAGPYGFGPSLED